FSHSAYGKRAHCVAGERTEYLSVYTKYKRSRSLRRREGAVRLCRTDAGTGEKDPGAVREERKICRRSAAYCRFYHSVSVSSPGYYGPVQGGVPGRKTKGV